MADTHSDGEVLMPRDFPIVRLIFVEKHGTHRPGPEAAQLRQQGVQWRTFGQRSHSGDLIQEVSQAGDIFGKQPDERGHVIRRKHRLKDLDAIGGEI